MDAFYSSFSSLASASSSTLIVTPHPHSKGDDPIFPLPSSQRKRPPGVPMTRMIPPTRMSGKGFIEPHHSHLPRRSKKHPSRPRSSSFDTNKTEAGFESKDTPPRSLSRDPIERRPVAVPAPSSSPVSKEVRHDAGPLQPHITNLPRRHARRPHSIAQRREELLCLQEIGKGSKVFVGISGRKWKGEPSGSSSDDESDDEDEEGDLKQRYSAIVRLVPNRAADHDNDLIPEHDKCITRLWLPASEPHEAGCTQLSIRQLRMGCSFLHRADGQPVLILAPPSCVIDAFSLAVCYRAATALPPSGHRPPSPCAEPSTPRPHESSHSDLPPDDAYTKIHEIITKMHDEDLMVIDDENGRRSGRGDLKPGPSGLRNEWRGLLRYEGILMLDGVWKPSPPC